MWGWLIDVRNAQAISAISFILTALGFALTLVALFFGYLRLIKIETAANASSAAVASFKLRIVQYDAANDVSRAAYALGVARKHLDNGSWSDVAAVYDDVRTSMLRVIQALTEEDTDLVTDIKRMNIHIIKFCDGIDAISHGSSIQRPVVNTVRKMIRTHSDLIERAQRLVSDRAV